MFQKLAKDVTVNARDAAEWGIRRASFGNSGYDDLLRHKQVTLFGCTYSFGGGPGGGIYEDGVGHQDFYPGREGNVAKALAYLSPEEVRQRYRLPFIQGHDETTPIRVNEEQEIDLLNTLYHLRDMAHGVQATVSNKGVQDGSRFR